MRVLVTGGTGFVGQHLVGALLRRGDRVCAMGRDFSQAQGVLAAGAEPIKADLADAQAVMAACEGMDAVCHVGALSAAWGPWAEFYATNVRGTAAVVEGCRRHGVRRLVHVSSPAVLFDGRDHRNLTEAAPYPRRFTSRYARSKKLAEDLVNAAEVPHVILRPKAIFGPGDRSLLPRVIEAARAGRLRQIGDGQNLVDLTYVENVADAIVLALDGDSALGKTFMITNGEHVRLWDVIRQVLRHMSLSPMLRSVPLPLAMAAATLMEWRAHMTGHEPMLTRYSTAILARTQTYDISLARRALNYTPRVSVAEGIERTLAALAGAGPGAA